ncbi:hypothetical protein EVAR_41639_1 [Eumeta japonica]|uniref:Helitron helicase-like domain-containing protein n=1 Tax=Eumeta variegata TaxID=151549 RepID=A0A4C1X1D9_EUMVA|nr:hypothetical protein EVAR_41639_1 [Eumeta japonica]
MPPKRQAIGRSTHQSRKKRALRASESDKQRALRLENLRVHAAETRSFESSEQREVSALKFKNETPGMCCVSGKVKLPELHLPPEPLLTLLSGVTRESKHFLENIRKYNSCLQMTSFGATNIVRENYMPTFRVQWQIYHRDGSLLPLPDADHKFLQIYFVVNSDEQIEQRCNYNAGTRREIVAALQALFDQHNELFHLFKTAIQ